MHPTGYIVVFLAAGIAGTLNAIAGGGSFISFPTLLFLGMPPVQANATNTVGLWPGLAASGAAYLRLLKVPARLLAPLLATALAGGFLGGLLLIKTPQQTFEHLIPWLLLAASLLFTFGNRIRAMAGHTATVHDLHSLSLPSILLFSLINLAAGVYAGYFGGGIGFVVLAMLTAIGMSDVHNMNALRTVLAAAMNAAAVVTFIVAGAVYWPQCLVMIAGALSGGWFGAKFAQRADPKKMRHVIIALGVALTLYFFVTVYGRYV